MSVVGIAAERSYGESGRIEEIADGAVAETVAHGCRTGYLLAPYDEPVVIVVDDSLRRNELH